MREGPGRARLARERAGAHQQGPAGILADGDLPAEALGLGREEGRHAIARVVETRLVVQALEPLAEGEDVGRGPRLAAGGEVFVRDGLGEGAREPRVGREDGRLARRARRQAGNEVAVRECAGRGGRHAAIMAGRWLAP